MVAATASELDVVYRDAVGSDRTRCPLHVPHLGEGYVFCQNEVGDVKKYM